MSRFCPFIFYQISATRSSTVSSTNRMGRALFTRVRLSGWID